MRAAVIATLAFVLPVFAYAAQININTASAAQLDTLSGIGPAKAQAIIDYRTAHGPFVRIEDIQNVKGIVPAIFANIQSSITVGQTSSKPQQADTSYKQVKAVEPVTNQALQSTSHVEASSAPATAPISDAAGATQPNSELPNISLSGSPWLYALLGVMVLASGAFILI